METSKWKEKTDGERERESYSILEVENSSKHTAAFVLMSHWRIPNTKCMTQTIMALH